MALSTDQPGIVLVNCVRIAPADRCVYVITIDDHLAAKSHADLGSKQSLVSNYSALLHNAADGVGTGEDDLEQGQEDDSGLTTGTADQYIKDAIPFLPLPIAILFFMLNVLLPGSGQSSEYSISLLSRILAGISRT